jgi:hypothetical protein
MRIGVCCDPYRGITRFFPLACQVRFLADASAQARTAARRKIASSFEWRCWALLHKSRPFFNEFNDLASFAGFDKYHEFNELSDYATMPELRYIRAY